MWRNRGQQYTEQDENIAIKSAEYPLKISQQKELYLFISFHSA